MAKQKLDLQTKRTLLNARKMIQDVAKADGNEAETRRRVERILGSVMGYNIFKHITREYAVHGVGDTEYCDFAIQIDSRESAIPCMLIELKRVNIDLATKHLKQVATYAIDMGCEWTLLTNGKEWKLYHILFGRPPQTKLVESWNLIDDDPITLARKFDLVSYKNVKRNGLKELWQKSTVLAAHNILKAILSEESITLLQRRIKREAGVMVSPEDIVGAIRHILNEAAASEMDKIKISLPEKKQRKKNIVKSSKEEDESIILQADKKS
jgi:hypothetical protein